MKLQLGMFNTDGRPGVKVDATRMLGDFSDCKAETSGEFLQGPLLMIYRGDQIAPEEEYEIQPLHFGELALTWDGRLDNRAEIAALAGFAHAELMPDLEIVARAYEPLVRQSFPA